MWGGVSAGSPRLVYGGRRFDASNDRGRRRTSYGHRPRAALATPSVTLRSSSQNGGVINAASERVFQRLAHDRARFGGRATVDGRTVFSPSAKTAVVTVSSEACQPATSVRGVPLCPGRPRSVEPIGSGQTMPLRGHR